MKHRLLLGFLLTLSLACIAAIIFFFVRMYQRDMQELTDFIDSYQVYDHAISKASEAAFATTWKSTPAVDEEIYQANTALSNLTTKSSVQISSLIKNEKKAMHAMRAIADLSNNEMSTLNAYLQTTDQETNREALEQAFHDLTKERQAVFTIFQELGR